VRKRCWTTRRWSAGLLAAWLCMDGSPAAAEAVPGARPLELREVLASAERAHPLMLAAGTERRLAQGELQSAEGGFDLSWKARGTLTPLGYYERLRAETTLEKPTEWWGASVFAGWRLGTGEFPIYDGDQQTLDYGELRAGLHVPLWRNGPIDRRRASLERAELGLPIAELAVAQQRLELRRAAAQRYWSWVAAGRRAAIAEALLANVVERDGGILQRVSTGDLPPIERVENQRAIEQRRALLAQAQRGLEQAGIELGLLLRDDRGEPTLPSPERLPEAFPELAQAEPSMAAVDLRLARKQRPEARRFSLQEGQQRVELGWAENQLAPGIDVQVAVAQDIGPSSDARPDLSETVLEASVLLDLPLQTGSARGRLEIAAASAERLGQQARLARDRIAAEVRDAHSAISAARQRIQATRREVALALELEAGERTRFEQGDSNLLLVNLREQQTAEAQLREVDAVLDYYRAAADLEAARGD
jgi:cobalt-zinc-cadmium efflux system outer membrane protein